MNTVHALTNTSDVVEAMRNLQTENDRWQLAEALARQIPTGTDGLGDIVDAAAQAGVGEGLTFNTLRLYRDTANRWPADQRVPNVGFSAHREAMTAGSLAEARKLLMALADTLGAGKVTVASVRKAVAAKNGKVSTAGATAGSTSTTKATANVLADLMSGGSELIAAIGTTTDAADLDKLQAGLTKVLTHVERLRAKAARKAATTKKAAAKPAPVATKKSAPRKGRVGDMRGM